MNIWLLLLTFFNIILLAGLMLSLFLRIKEKAEDQRLQKGLQLLQNKISILEDLSDRTDEQVQKLVRLIDNKVAEIRHNLAIGDTQISQLENAIQRGLDIIHNVQNQPSQEEQQMRQRSSQCVAVVKLAKQGLSVQDISKELNLSPAEIQMIIHVNKDQLQFSEDNLPAWIQNQFQLMNKNSTQNEIDQFAAALALHNSTMAGKKLNQVLSETAFDSVKQDLSANNQLQKELQKTKHQVPQFFEDNTVQSSNPTVAVATQGAPTNSNSVNKEKNIRPFEFRRI